ncbi:hypothetical protein [Pedobacter soli]|uniref:DUF5648 domain-containing protein n=1 Tax=Pedobacter soli TaxID=390242 RepID=A0A1G6UFH5_9SPHI|nr:hypothetical protein [Pedobacter soli]SDD39994.1 hypothetical protein SAMN04488024_105329 [Pedobacter soli]
MRRIIFLLASVLLMLNLKSQAQTLGVSLNDFSIKNEYLSEGKIYSPNGVAISGNFGFVRTSSNGNPINVKLVYVEGGVETTISAESVYKGSWSNETSWMSEVSGKLTTSQTSGKVYLKFTIYNLNGTILSENLSTLAYSITISNQASSPGDSELPATPPPFTVPVNGSIPLFEFYSATLNSHFYSTEYKNYSGYVFSRILGYVFTSPQPGTSPMYRFKGPNYYAYSIIPSSPYIGYNYDGLLGYIYLNQVSKTIPIYHHQTSIGGDIYWFDGPGGFSGYDFLGIQFYILQNPQPTTYPLPEEDTMELYQYYSTNGDHFYTTLKKDRPGFTYEKILGYVHTIQKPGTIPLYRYYTSVSIAKDHYYTTVKQNYNNYVYEGIVGYVYPNAGAPGTTPIYSYYASVNGDHYYNNVNSTYGGYVNEGVKFWMLQYNH